MAMYAILDRFLNQPRNDNSRVGCYCAEHEQRGYTYKLHQEVQTGSAKVEENPSPHH